MRGLFSAFNFFPYLLENNVGVSAPDTLNGGHGEHDVPLTVNVGVEHTQNVLEIGRNHQRHLRFICLELKSES